MKRLSETGKESLFEDANNDERSNFSRNQKENGEENGEEMGKMISLNIWVMEKQPKRRSFVPEGNFKIFTNNERGQ